MTRNNTQQPRKVISTQSYLPAGHIVQPGPIPQPLHVFYPYGCYPSPHTQAAMNHSSSPARLPNDNKNIRKPVRQQSSYAGTVGVASATTVSKSSSNVSAFSSPARSGKPGISPNDNNQAIDGHPGWGRHMQSPYNYPHPSSYSTEWGNAPPHHPIGPTIQYQHWSSIPPPGNGRYTSLQPSAIQHSHLPPDGRHPFWFSPAIGQRFMGSRSPQTATTLHNGAYHTNEKTTGRPTDRLRHPVTSFGSSNIRPSLHKEDECPIDLAMEERATSPSQIEVNHRDEVENTGCTCKKTNCLKLYCQCFAIKIFCGENCRCKHCYNNLDHEKDRREAMRNILNRNPGAFETKFKKSSEALSVETAAIVEYEIDKILTHKIGCKCRKSNCMKKYCECYAARVRCNSTCRCCDCKNTVDGAGFDFRDSLTQSDNHITLSNNNSTSLSAPITIDSVGLAYQKQTAGLNHTNTNDPWEAAHNLAFMKRSSPVSEAPKCDAVNEISNGELLSIPSLASSSDGTATSTGDCMKTNSQSKSDYKKEAVDEMLLAAVAMTEFINSPPPSKQYLATCEKAATSQIRASSESYDTSVSKFVKEDQDPNARLPPQVKRHLAFDCKKQSLQKKKKTGI